MPYANNDDYKKWYAANRERLIAKARAAELANLAGKMIGSAKVQVEYYALRKEQPRIEWLESPNAELTGAAKRLPVE